MHIYDSLIYLIFLSLFLSFFVLRRNRRNPQNISFAALSLGIALWILGIYLLQITHNFYWPDKITLFGGILIAGGFYVFSYVFPAARTLPLRFLIRLAPLAVLVILLPFNFFITNIIELPGDNFVPVNGPLFPLYILVCGYYVLATVYNFALAYRNNIGYQRQRMLYVTMSLSFFLLVALICDLILPEFGITTWKFVGPLSSGLFLILSTIALVSYNLMDIRLVLKSVLVNSFSVVIVLTVAIILIHSRLLRGAAGPQAYLLLSFGAIFLFMGARAVLAWIFTRMFLRRYHLFRDSFNELNIFLHEEVSPGRIILTANKYLKKGLSLRWIYYFDVQRHEIVFAPNEDPIAAGKVRREQVFDEGLTSLAYSLHAIRFLYGAELEAFPKLTNSPIALLPLWNRGEMQGYFVLGPQVGLNGLSFEEGQAVQRAWAHMETAFDRALLYEGLEQRVRAQVQDINYKNRQLKKLVQKRLDFLQVASHQLRTPITSLSGALQLVMNRKSSPDEEHDLVEMAYAKTQELAAVVGSVLKMARINENDASAVQDCVNLNGVFARILPIIEASARAKDLYVRYEPVANAEIVGNESYLEQAFYNILENAVEHTAEGGVDISFSTDAASVTVQIRDSGPGIPAEIKSAVFSRQVQSSKPEGTGLGLYIAKTIIDAHPEGKISFESDSSGTVFHVSLKKYYPG